MTLPFRREASGPELRPDDRSFDDPHQPHLAGTTFTPAPSATGRPIASKARSVSTAAIVR
jgi:hypothetical protein